MRKPVNNETNLINQIWNTSNRILNEQAVPGQFPAQSLEYDIDSLDLSDYTPEEQAEIKKQLKAQNAQISINSIAKPGEIGPADQKGVQKALRANKNVAVDSKGKKWYISDFAKNIDWEPPTEPESAPEPTSSEQPMDAATKQFKTAEKIKKNIPGLNWAQLTADAINQAKNFVGPVAPSEEERDNEARRESLKGHTDVMGTVEYPDSVFTNYEKDQQAAKEKAQAKYRGMLPGANWAELAADSIKKAKEAAKGSEGPTIEISDADLEGDGEIVVDMRGVVPTPQKPERPEPEFPHWGESPHGYDPTTPEQAKAAEEWRNEYNKALEASKQPKPILTPVIKSPEELYGRALAKGTINADEYRRLMGDDTDSDTDTTNYAKQLDNKVQTGKVTPIRWSGEQKPALPEMPVGSGVLAPETPKPTKYTPIPWPGEKKKEPLPSMPVGGGVLSSETQAELEAKKAEQERRDRLNKKYAAERETATPEQRKGVEDSAARLSKETGKQIAPWSVEHSDALAANKKKMEAEIAKIKADAAAEQQRYAQSTPSAQAAQTTPGRDTKNIVPGSAMWGELSSSEKKQISDRYSRGEGPSISIRYNKDTGKFDEPGYGDQGKYGDIVKALNTVNENTSVMAYANFITEMAKAKSGTAKPKKEEKPKATKPETEKKSKVAPAETKPAVAAAPAPTPVAAARPIPPALQRPVHGGRSEGISPQPPVASPETAAPVQPAATGNPAFPKLPEGYKGNIKYKLGKTSVSADFSNPVAGSEYFTPQTPKPMSALDRYLAGSQFKGSRQDYFGHLKDVKEPITTVIKPEPKQEPVVTKPSGIPVRVASSKPSNILSTTGKAVGVGLGLAGLLTAAMALPKGQKPTNIKSGAASQVNTKDTPRAQMSVSEIVRHKWEPGTR